MLNSIHKEAIICQLCEFQGTLPYFYLKFCEKEEYARDICNGNLYANTPAHFRELEMHTGNHGQGDKNELILNVGEVDGAFYDYNTDNVLFPVQDATLSMSFSKDNGTPMVSFYGIYLQDMRVLNISECCASFQFPFNKKDCKKLERDFGPYCVLIKANDLAQNIANFCSETQTSYILGRVEYVKPNDIGSALAFSQQNTSRFLYKDYNLCYQKEHRLVIDTTLPRDHFFRIGKLETSDILNSKDLMNMRFKIRYEIMRAPRTKAV